MATIYENYTGSYDSLRAIYPDIWIAQTFTPSKGHFIQSISLKLQRYNTPGIATVSIKATVGDHPSGSDLCLASFDADELVEYPGSWPYVWKEIEFNPGTSLSADTKYAIVARAPNGSGSTPANWLLWFQDTTAPTYTGGNREYSDDNGGTWASDENKDMFFKESGVGGSGFIWVDNTKLHFISEAGEGIILGTVTGDTSVAGHLFVEGTNLHYIDANGNERYQAGYVGGASGATGAHLWIEGNKLRYINSSGNESQMGTWVLGQSSLNVDTILED